MANDSSNNETVAPQISPELAAEFITVRIRWFGLCVGYVLVNFLGRETNVAELNLILTVGAAYALLDTLWSVRQRVLLSEFRLVISVMEAIFIGLLCYYDAGIASPFRFYYFLSLLVCAMRHEPIITFATFGLHVLSYVLLAAAIGVSNHGDWVLLVMMTVFMAWVTWTVTSLTGLIKSTARRTIDLNAQLTENQQLLEKRIDERTHELQESQAVLVQQEKQAAFGLLAAGIAHEVGNPLASISSLVQMLKLRDIDENTDEKLGLVGEQLLRIQRTLRELIDFSRPAQVQPTMCDVHEAIDAAINIAKYYKRRKGRLIETDFNPSIGPIRIVRDQLVQVILNLVLNSLDATEEGQRIDIRTRQETTVDEIRWIRIDVADTGHGIPDSEQAELFRPYFTTKETGTGLGLFVCRRIIEQLGGRMELASSNSTGTTFSVWLRGESRSEPEQQPNDKTSTITGPMVN
ncbi:MAG: sensor histidine kinase [Planctomycetaceae bacterium]